MKAKSCWVFVNLVIVTSKGVYDGKFNKSIFNNGIDFNRIIFQYGACKWAEFSDIRIPR